MADTENLDCPFCGGACDPEGWVGSGIGGTPVRGPECQQCGACTDTIEDWNRRATPPSPSTAPEVNDLLTYPSPHGTLVRLADVKCRIASANRAALASLPAEVDDEGLPPLPDAWHGFRFNSGWNTWEQVSHWAKGDDDVARAYTAEQFRQGQRDAVAADRARRDKGGA